MPDGSCCKLSEVRQASRRTRTSRTRRDSAAVFRRKFSSFTNFTRGFCNNRFNKILICSENPILHLQFITMVKKKAQILPLQCLQNACMIVKGSSFLSASFCDLVIMETISNIGFCFSTFRKRFHLFPEFPTQGDWNHS